jgi:hypothetical protein
MIDLWPIAWLVTGIAVVVSLAFAVALIRRHVERKRTRRGIEQGYLPLSTKLDSLRDHL